MTGPHPIPVERRDVAAPIMGLFEPTSARESVLFPVPCVGQMETFTHA